MLSLDAKYRIADRLGTALGDFLRGTLTGATALLPQNGREHVRRVASLHLTQALRPLELHGVTLELEWGASLWRQVQALMEPETLSWLDQHILDGETLWDVGANLGLYALWCAKRHPGCRVVAFEPNALTHPLLVRHAIANGVADRVTALPIALSAGPPSIEAFRLSTMIPGKAANQLDVDGAPPMHAGIEAARYAVLAGSADALIRLLDLPRPDHLKIDVDGIEPLILAGAAETLRTVRSVLVEDEHNQDRLAAIEAPLRAAGLVEDASFRGSGSGRNRLYLRAAG